MNDQLVFRRFDAHQITDALLQECATLFSTHYGKWSNEHSNPSLRGRPIRTSVNRLRRDYLGDKCWLATARSNGCLVGYAIAQWIPYSNETISWVVQLVVHEDFRKQLVASRLLNSIWGQSDHFAWGIASANPFAVRALEKATRRFCVASEIHQRAKPRDRAVESVKYMVNKTITVTETESVIDTGFDQDLSSLESMLAAARRSGKPWGLGDLPRAHEWLAMTFRPQEQSEWSQEEFLAFLATSSQITAEAYDRMAEAQRNEPHSWARPEHAAKEVDFLIERMKLPAGCRILDMGCGNGRHALALAERGFIVTGVDRSVIAIEQAKKLASLNDRVTFVAADVLAFTDAEGFDAAICLYDVIGSYCDDDANVRLLEKLLSLVKPKAPVAVSVMSFDYMQALAMHQSNGDAQRYLPKLEPSNTMEKTGDVFHPERVLLDKKLRLAFRKEKFLSGEGLPEELLVVDRRYGFEELRALCDARMDVELIGYVRAGHFEDSDKTEKPTKEILVIGRKRLA